MPKVTILPYPYAGSNRRILTLESFDRAIGWGSFTLVSGRGNFVYRTAEENFMASKIGIYNSNPASGLTLARMGLYTIDLTTSALTLVARTANDLTIGNSASQERSFDTTGGFPATYQIRENTRYAMAILEVGTTPSGPASISGINSGISALPPRMAGAFGGLSDLTVSQVEPTVGAGCAYMWVSA